MADGSSTSKQNTQLALIAASLLIGFVGGSALDKFRSSSKSLVGGGGGGSKVKLQYFDIAGRAEPVRLALAVAGIPFDDVRIVYKEWATIKPTTKYGQLPILTLPDGTVFSQSEAMLRWAGSEGDGSLYPSDPMMRFKVDEAIGMINDLDKAWMPALYMGMRPALFGHDVDKMDDKAKSELVKNIRETFLKEKLPTHMKHLGSLLFENKGHFLCGNQLTIADLLGYATLAYFQKGVADHVPKTCLDEFPIITAWLQRVKDHPKVAAYYASK
eukprot:CAMPEP_0119549894 /NCGR_PEP_ID=MMETSP1352-20130426/3519_1 /TAXON_ID=265584 /ORGANISM="Stauroneis constricta, Strain CCMP1120" /LENGTH=270 /DNA_ID=CAMNT_0007595585 /DNA_START=31 /DNA_END=843 /DNA_ORIENTATION=-